MTLGRFAFYCFALGAATFATGAQAGSAYDEALKNGAVRLTSDEIDARLTGKTVTFIAADSGAKFLVYYGEGNETATRKVDGDKSLSGFHAFTDDDQVCFGWQGMDLPRLRCVDVLLIDGKMHKFRPDGSLSGHVEEVVEGNAT